MPKIISPDEAHALALKEIPEEIIECFNDMIVKHLNTKYDCCTIKQKDILAYVEEKTGYTSDEIFKKRWFDVEELFEKAGWEVKYDKPGFNENYDATFEFNRKKK